LINLLILFLLSLNTADRLQYVTRVAMNPLKEYQCHNSCRRHSAVDVNNLPSLQDNPLRPEAFSMEYRQNHP
jgi:hypothetical protein